MLGEKDHGKSTLIGRLIRETKSMPDDRMRSAKNASKALGKKFEWAHLLDSFRYEKEREMTLDTTRALVKLGKKHYEFIDIPGHKELIKNMLTGAGDAKYGILVIDAEEGVKLQTLRHIEIAKFLGIKKIIVVANKMDKIGYSQSGFLKIQKAFKSAIPIAASKGENVIKKSKKMPWWTGPTLQQAIFKIFKTSNGVGGKSHLLKRALNLKATCLFLEKPHKTLSLESGFDFKIYPILKLNGFSKINSLEKVSIKLRKRRTIKRNFVIKTGGKIVGICKAI